MTDNEARGIVLRRIYELRNSGRSITMSDLKDLSFEWSILGRHIVQLRDLDLIEAKILKSYRGPGDDVAQAVVSISVRGCEAIENPQTAPRQVMVDQSRHTHVQGSGNLLVIGDGNTQTVSLDIAKLNAAIDGSQATAIEKQEAKSAIRKLLESKLALTVLASFFTGVPTAE